MKFQGVFLAFFFCGILLAAAEDGIKIVDAQRNIDLTSQFARHSLALKFENSGSKAVNQLLLSFETPSLLALVEVKDSNGKVLAAKKTSTKNSADIYTVDLTTPLAQRDTALLNVLAVYNHKMTPFPAEIAQTERQFVLYKDNHYVSSPYPVKSQKTTIKLASSKVEKRSELAPSNLKGDTLTYGPYEDREPFSSSELSVHFENVKPFLAASVVTEVEVSHWGNVAVEETYQIQHNGAKLKGLFSRLDFQRNPGMSSNAVTVLTRSLPLDAADVYYRDEIGNISTSNLWLSEKDHTLQLGPRFPLFGGWKIGFYMGFNLPAYNHLAIDNDDRSRYVLTVPFVPNLKDVAYDEAVLRIILPEGASEISFDAPFPVDSQGADTVFTYLDTVGRPVLVLNKKTLSTEHSSPIKIIYRYSSSSLLREPFLLIVAYFSVFVGIIAYLRLNFSIGQTSKKLAPNTVDIDRAIEVVKPVYLERKPTVAELAKAVEDLKTQGNKAYEAFQKQQQRTEQMMKKNVSKVEEAVSKLKGVEPKFAETVSQLLAKQRDIVETLVVLGEVQNQKIQKKLNQQDYKSKNDALQATVDEMNVALEDLEEQIF